MEKTFADRYIQNSDFAKIFSLERFLLYGIQLSLNRYTKTKVLLKFGSLERLYVEMRSKKLFKLPGTHVRCTMHTLSLCECFVKFCILEIMCVDMRSKKQLKKIANEPIHMKYRCTCMKMISRQTH